MKNKFGIPDFQIKFDEKGFFKRESIKPITREDYKEHDPVDYPAHYNKGAVQ